MMMENSTSCLRRLAQATLLTLLFTGAVPATAQISFNHDGSNPDTRKVRREAARYKADGVKESHLDMKKFSYKKGEPGKRDEGELAYDEIYQAPSPVTVTRKPFWKRR